MNDMFRRSNYLSYNPKSSKAVEKEKHSAFSGKWDCGALNNDPPPWKNIPYSNPENKWMFPFKDKETFQVWPG